MQKNQLMYVKRNIQQKYNFGNYHKNKTNKNYEKVDTNNFSLETKYKQKNGVNINNNINENFSYNKTIINGVNDEINTRSKINAARLYNYASLIKKLFHDIPYARALSFFDKIREIHATKNKNEKLGQALKKANDEMKDKHKNQVLNKILKLYTYKKLDNMLKACDDYDQKILKTNSSPNIISKNLLIVHLKLKNL